MVVLQIPPGLPTGWGDATGWTQREDPVVGTWAWPAVTAVRVALCAWVKEKKDLEISQRALPGLSAAHSEAEITVFGSDFNLSPPTPHLLCASTSKYNFLVFLVK